MYIKQHVSYLCPKVFLVHVCVHVVKNVQAIFQSQSRQSMVVCQGSPREWIATYDLWLWPFFVKCALAFANYIDCCTSHSSGTRAGPDLVSVGIGCVYIYKLTFVVAVHSILHQCRSWSLYSNMHWCVCLTLTGTNTPLAHVMIIIYCDLRQQWFFFHAVATGENAPLHSRATCTVWWYVVVCSGLYWGRITALHDHWLAMLALPWCNYSNWKFKRKANFIHLRCILLVAFS